MRAMDLVGLSSARGSKYNQSEESICWPIRAKELEIQPIIAFLPECNAWYRWRYKRHCAFISPISFSDTYPTARQFVWKS